MRTLLKLFSVSFLLSLSFGSRLTALDYVSQAGQDQWVIEEAFNFKKNGYFIDIGAADGKYISNTYVLEKSLQWKGICIEANPVYFNDLDANRNCILVKTCLDYTNHEVDFRCTQSAYYDLWSGIIDNDTDNKDLDPSTTIKLQTRTLEQVLDECKAPHVIDFLSIDVEGAEHRIFKNFPFEKYRFLAMVIERPTPELNAQLQKNGYVFVKNGPCDSYYIHPSIPNFNNIRKEPFSQIPKQE